MARIDWVKQRLQDWAAWATAKESGALGYPKQSAFLRLTPSRSTPDSGVPICAIDASLTDSAVQSLRFTHAHLWLCLRLHYIERYEIKRVAKTMARAESTTKAHLEQADALLAQWFRAREQAKRGP